MEAREWQPLWRLGKDLDSDTGRKICFTNCNDHPRGVSYFEREDFSWSRHRQQLLNEKRRARTWSLIRPWWGLESPSPPRQRDNHIPGLTDRHCPSQKQTHWDSSQPPDGGLSSDKKGRANNWHQYSFPSDHQGAGQASHGDKTESPLTKEKQISKGRCRRGRWLFCRVYWPWAADACQNGPAPLRLD